MKVGKKGVLAGTEVLADEALRALRAKIDQQKKGIKDAATAEAQQTDRVDINLGQLIQSELDPTRIAAERKARLEELKRLIKEGKYNPSSEAVAKSLIENVAVELMTAPPEFDD